MVSKHVNVDNSRGDSAMVVPDLVENGLVLWPVAFDMSGEGLPYAPVNWPNPGDVWGWKVGKRKSAAGFMLDRYLIPPSRLTKPGRQSLKLPSKAMVIKYIKEEFPDADIDAFFASFSWKVPSNNHNWGKDELALCSTFKDDNAESSGSKTSAVTMDYKARVRSLQRETQRNSLSPTPNSKVGNHAKLVAPRGDSDVAPDLMENDLVLWPVAFDVSGEGLPYAPVNWPTPGDVWGWKVGKRKSAAGFMLDRYLIPPSRLTKPGRQSPKLPSKAMVIKYMKEEFPDADIDAFFASFSWKVPSNNHNWGKDGLAIFSTLKEDKAEHSGSKRKALAIDCKAQNIMCSSKRQKTKNSLPPMACDVCCSESSFCRNCCCILCSRTIDWAHGGYSFIRCEGKHNETYICGHAAHVDCALRSYMAGTVGGSIGLDAGYYCRRCDHKTDLVPHVAGFLRICKRLTSRDRNDIEKILNVGICILRGSQRITAIDLLNQIELALRKLKDGATLKRVWSMEDTSVVSPVGGAKPHLRNNGAFAENLEVTDTPYPLDVSAPNELNTGRSQEPVYITSDHQIESLKLDNEIDQVLRELKKSQESEFKIAEDKLYAKKELILSLYRKLDLERSELANRSSVSKNSDIEVLLTNVFNRVDQIRKEVGKLKDMERIAKGFGKTPIGVLKEHFGLHIRD